jgi:glycerophosphoryl diester phosphodiesterase
MVIIAHRGNVSGPASCFQENTVKHIEVALALGFDVELDVWFTSGRFYLGHDEPNCHEEVDISFLKNERFWVHCKNVMGMVRLNGTKIHRFFHNTDDVVLTSQGYLWTFPGKPVFSSSIAVMPETTNQDISKAFGICTDRALEYRTLLTRTTCT